MEVCYYDYVLKKKIGSGSFGDVWLGKHKADKTEPVAIKLQQIGPDDVDKTLYKETKILQCLAGKSGFPKLIRCGIEDAFFVMACELLGPTLQDLMIYHGGKFSLKTTLLLADQILQRVEILHSINFIHRDIKPENFCIGVKDNKDLIYMIDFGLAKRYSDPRTGLHIKYQTSRALTGTARYVSINSHLGLEQSRRDDLESVGYLLIYFLRGNLPWQGLEASGRSDQFKKILECKLNTPIDELCKGYPEEFEQYLKYCRNLQFEESPDYEWMKNLFRNLYFKTNLVWDNAWDWSYIDNRLLLKSESHSSVNQLHSNISLKS